MRFNRVIEIDLSNKYHLLGLNNTLIPWLFSYLIRFAKNFLIVLPFDADVSFTLIAISLAVLMNLYNLYLASYFGFRGRVAAALLIFLNFSALLLLGSISIFTAIPNLPLLIGTLQSFFG
ncbi:hypothetical protein [Pseudovibrio brasiliensis]|uniref:Uncharacterized protein n=1 Tax=Pseudovibrio brasiliensis TaxID=1898042 RepID=A0ABX8AW16_9HYPH|nr:hypothetical protein [Pseudovibrio brasiliensis]QUS58905.1 hypothetical protein KGB56_24590 [Pseudovibrio brasiliensis]